MYWYAPDISTLLGKYTVFTTHNELNRIPLYNYIFVPNDLEKPPFILAG